MMIRSARGKSGWQKGPKARCFNQSITKTSSPATAAHRAFSFAVSRLNGIGRSFPEVHRQEGTSEWKCEGIAGNSQVLDLQAARCRAEDACQTECSGHDHAKPGPACRSAL